jgi:hypothetical protein
LSFLQAHSCGGDGEADGGGDGEADGGGGDGGTRSLLQIGKLVD